MKKLTKLSCLITATLISGFAQANFLGYEETDFNLKAGYMFAGSGLPTDQGAVRSTAMGPHPTVPGAMIPVGEPMAIASEPIDDSYLVYGAATDTYFSWGNLHLKYGGGLKDGVNNDGELLLSALFIDTPFKALKLFGGYERQEFDQGRTEQHLRYGFGFGAPILPGDQLIKGYIAKRDTKIEYNNLTHIDGDNGYVLGLNTDYKINDKFTLHFLGEFAWDRQFRELNTGGAPRMVVDQMTNIFMLGEQNLKSESIKFVTNLGYALTDSIEIGAEFLYMRGEGIVINHAAMYGATIKYSF